MNVDIQDGCAFISVERLIATYLGTVTEWYNCDIGDNLFEHVVYQAINYEKYLYNAAINKIYASRNTWMKFSGYLEFSLSVMDDTQIGTALGLNAHLDNSLPDYTFVLT